MCRSSAGLLRAPVAEVVDDHEVVLRFNHAPTRAYETAVGRKTTLRFFNHDPLMVVGVTDQCLPQSPSRAVM